MHRALVTLVLLAGCDRVWGLEREVDAPLPIDAAPDAPPDAASCYGTGMVTVCLRAPPSESFDVELGGTFTVDTDSSPRCAEYSGEAGWCVIAATTVTINGTLRGRGTKPLVLVASSAVTIAGAVDVSSDNVGGAGSDPVGCPTGIGGMLANGGGAGGTFGGSGGKGGAGGVSGAGGLPAAVTVVEKFRGGCRGGNGASTGGAGLGGGALFVISGKAILVSGVIDASGNGGRGGVGSPTATPGGGAGGGSGGMIGLDAPMILVSGNVLANGGGGGEGGGQPNFGEQGAKATMALVPARGGTMGTLPGGDGGDGAAGVPMLGGNGKAGTSSIGGGGGGGGGAGIIRVFPPVTLGGNVSPPPS